MIQDSVFKYIRTRHLNKPGKSGFVFDVEVWQKLTPTPEELTKLSVDTAPDALIITIDDAMAVDMIEQGYPLPQHLKTKCTRSVLHKGNLVLCSAEVPFLDTDHDESDVVAKSIPEFLIDGDNNNLLDPKDGFKRAGKYHFRKVNGEDPNAKDEHGYRRHRRRRWHDHDDDFELIFIKYKAGHDYTVKTPVRNEPVLRSHLEALCQHITSALPGEIKMWSKMEVKQYQNMIQKHIADFVRLYGKNGYRHSIEFLSLLHRYLKSKKASQGKLEDAIWHWLEAEAKSRVVQKRLREINKAAEGTDWSRSGAMAYGFMQKHDRGLDKVGSVDPIREAHSAANKKHWEEQERKLAAQKKELEKQEAAKQAAEQPQKSIKPTTKRRRKHARNPKANKRRAGAGHSAKARRLRPAAQAHQRRTG